MPIFVHGDDAESHRRRSFCVVSWGSCLTHGSPYDTRFVIYAGDNNRCFDASYQALDAWVVWSLQELLIGEWAQTDPWGQPMQRSKHGPIANGWRACLVVHKGDESYLAKAYKTTNTWVSHDICMLCKAWWCGGLFPCADMVVLLLANLWIQLFSRHPGTLHHRCSTRIMALLRRIGKRH